VRSKKAIGALDQQTSEIGVTGVGDAEVRVIISRLTSTRSQAQIAPDVGDFVRTSLYFRASNEG